jgi:hypothetical protein
MNARNSDVGGNYLTPCALNYGSIIANSDKQTGVGGCKNFL